MAKRSIPCPKCGAAIAVPEEPGEFLVCGECRAKLKIAAARARPVAEPAPNAFEDLGDDDEEAISQAPLARKHQPSGPPIGMIAAIAACLVLVIGGGVAAFFIFGSGEKVVKDKGKDNKTVNVDAGAPNFNLKSTQKPVDPRVEEVDRAIKRGKEYLRSQILTQEPKKIRPYTELYPAVYALMGLALLETGAKVDDEAVQRVAKIVREETGKRTSIYALSTCLFFMNRLAQVESKKFDDTDRKLAVTFALRIIAGQRTSGVWDYYGVELDAANEAKLLADLKSGTYKPSKAETLDAEGIPLGFTMSNSQFAMLALWGARQHGIDVKIPLLAFADFCKKHQQADGHWQYSNKNPLFGEQYETMSSTCCGLISLAIERALKEDKEFIGDNPPQKVDQSKLLGPGFAYVGRSIGRKKGDPGGAPRVDERGTLFGADAWGDLYFLWCVERLGMIYKMDEIGGKDKNWYEWGRPIVLKAQRKDGSWVDKHGPLVDTCFALLFLKKANLADDLAKKLLELAMMLRGPTQFTGPPWHGRPLAV